MRVYAQTSARRSRQVLGDLVALAVIAVSVWIALTVRHAILRLAAPGKSAQSAGEELAGSLDSAGNAAGKVPIVGGSLKGPLHSASQAGNDLSQAGQDLQTSVHHLATLVTTVLIGVPVVVVLLLWAATRLRWILNSARARRLLAQPGGADLFALRALTGPLRDLRDVEPPAQGLADAWRHGDPATVAALSRIGLARAGLKP